MKLRELTIKNYKSLRNVNARVGDFTTFIGANGSGKTNILEALFLVFNEFGCTGGGASSIFQQDFSWYNRDTSVPIEFTIGIHLTEKESQDLLPKKLSDSLREKNRDKFNELVFERQIAKPGAVWRTRYLKVADTSLVKDDKMLLAEDLTKSLTGKVLERPTKAVKAYLFAPDATQTNIVGDRLITINKQAYTMDEYTDRLVREGKIPFEHVSGKDYNTWIAENKLVLVGKPADRKEIDAFISKVQELLLSQEGLQEVCAKITQKLKGRFKLVPASRNVKTEPGSHETFLDKTTIMDPLAKLAASGARRNEKKFGTIRRAILDLLSKTLVTAPSLSTWENDVRFPIHLIGGGEQEVIGLLWELYSVENQLMFGIEEPETHLHHSLAQKLYRFLQEYSKENQIVIATHSPVFVDWKTPKNNWIVEKKEEETKIRRIEEMQEMLDVVGAKPSERGYPNKVLLVAGETEMDILPIWIKRMGIDTEGVKITGLYGERDRRKVETLQEYIRNTQTKLFLMVDDHGKDLVEIARREGLDESHCLILEGTIEDCYPIKTVVEGLNRIYGLDLKEEDIDPKVPRIEEIKTILHDNIHMSKRKSRWKRPLGKHVAELMAEKDIPSHVRDFIRQLADG